MQYTDFFKEAFNNTKKLPDLPQKEVHRLLSIALAEINLARFQEYPESRYKYTKEIKSLTENLTPEQLFKKILNSAKKPNS